MPDSLIAQLLQRKRMQNNLGQIGDDPSLLDPNAAMTPPAQTNPAPGIMAQQPQQPDPRLQSYSPLEMLLYRLKLLRLPQDQGQTTTAGLRG